MKHIIPLFLLIFVSTEVFNQIPPQFFPTNSNMRIEMRPGIYSPLTGGGGAGAPPGLFIGDYIDRLIHNQELTISNETVNANLYYPVGQPFASSAISYNYGKFHFEGISDVGIDTGIIISTGRVFYAYAPLLSGNGPGIGPGVLHAAQYHSFGGNLGFNGAPEPPDSIVNRWQQYPELVSLNNGDSIWDAAVMEFDFVPKGNFISLEYVFASEEWPLYNCETQTDVMGIFLSGPGIAGQKNIATLPESSTPVNPHTVYPPNTACRPENPGGSPYYVDNTGGQNIIYNGFTTVLTAASAVEPCQSYHLKIMIADGTEHSNDTTWKSPNFPNWESFMSYMGYESTKKRMMYDSGILLKMSSFRSLDSIRIEALGGTQGSAEYPYAVRGCLNGKLRIWVSKVLPISRSFEIEYGGSAVAGQDYASVSTTVIIEAGQDHADIPIEPLTQGSGTKTLEARVLSPYGSCSGWGSYLDSTRLVISDGYYVSVIPEDTAVCMSCSVSLQAVGEPFLSYEWSPATYLNSTIISNPVSTPLNNIVYTVMATAPMGYPCEVGSNHVSVNVDGSAIDELKNVEGIRIYPNPFKENFKLDIAPSENNKSFDIKLMDISGKLLWQDKGSIEHLNRKVQKISGTLEKGTYILELHNGKDKDYYQKIVKY